jgi:hypothetical protein
MARSHIRRLFWNAEEYRLRALWRLLLYVVVAAAVANPLIIVLDATDNPLLERSLENLLVAVGFLLSLWVQVWC